MRHGAAAALRCGLRAALCARGRPTAPAGRARTLFWRADAAAAQPPPPSPSPSLPRPLPRSVPSPADLYASLRWLETHGAAGADARPRILDLSNALRWNDALAPPLAQACGAWLASLPDDTRTSRAELLALALLVRLRTVPRSRARAVWDEMRRAHPAWRPPRSIGAWLVQRLAAASAPPCDDAVAVWSEMHAHAAVPDVATNALLTALGAHAAATALVRRAGVQQLDRVGLAAFLHAHTKSGTPSFYVPYAAAVLRARLLSGGARDAIAWHALIEYEGQRHGAASALQLAEDAVRRGALVPDAYTVSVVLQSDAAHLASLRSCDAALAYLRELEARLHVAPTAPALSMAVGAVLNAHGADPNQVYEAHALYTEGCAAFGIAPDKVLVQPLIEAHCRAFVPDVERAWALLDALWPPAPPRRLRRARPAPAAADLGTVYPILVACARLHDVPRATALLQRMAAHRIAMPPHAVLGVLRALLGACASTDEVRAVYAAVHGVGGWDRDTYSRVLAALCAWRLGGTAAPFDVPLQALSDMRAAGLHPTPQTYTVLLDFHAKTHASLAGVRATHALLQRDLQLEPDLVLMHALMNAYNYAGDAAQVLGIWDSLLHMYHATRSTQCLNDVTVTIVCDTCGRAGLLGAMRDVLAAVTRLDAQRLRTKIVLDAWAECLARCGRLAEAVDVVFTEMPRRADTRPDQKTLETLLKFARSDAGAARAIQQRWHAEAPHLPRDGGAPRPSIPHSPT